MQGFLKAGQLRKLLWWLAVWSTLWSDSAMSPLITPRLRFGLKSALISFLLIIMAASLTGCGFKIRGADLGLPFQTIAVQGGGQAANQVRFILKSQSGINLVDKSANAQVVMEVLSEDVRRTVVTFNSAGRPREIELRMTVKYRVTDHLAVELSPPQEVTQSRDISVNESEALAFGNAEEFMLNDMQLDIAYQLLRRLRSIKLDTSS
jgi:LPS-assembly lipoprotein